MISWLPISVGLGLAISLLFSEAFGLAAGGLVVPGYLAIAFSRPLMVVSTLGAGVIAALIVQGLSSVMILYGRRRTALTLLIGYLIGLSLAPLAPQLGGPSDLYAVVGFILPGLVALWCLRQGYRETVASVLLVSAAVRLLLILLGAPILEGAG
ncbi:MAG: poly-gamma-glutamate biosynthesis protein PgsC [Bradymonadia bacterium]